VIVVTDTSVVLNLCLLGEEAILPALYRSISAPEIVANEFNRLVLSDPRFRELVFPDCIELASPSLILPDLISTRRLDAGEIAAISLAVERRAEAILIDEKAGRAAASSLGLKPLGLLGVLLEAKRASLIADLSPLLDRLETEAKFRIGTDLRKRVLRAAGES
jgi:uncharacterized protein